MAPWPRTLIGWGERPGSSPPDFIWWQEIHPDMTAEVAREAGYQVVEVVPVEKVEEDEEAQGKGEENQREYERLVEQETLIFEATELISELIEEYGVSRKELAEKLRRSKGFVTQVLSGDRNMTLRTFSDFAFALEHRVNLAAAPLVESGHGGEAIEEEDKRELSK